jgi:hypothetical protein
MPSLAITDTFPVANQTERLALDAQKGDVAIQADNNTAYILAALPASTNGNWVPLPQQPYTTSTHGGSGNAGRLLALDAAGKADGRDLQADGAKLDGIAAGAAALTSSTPSALGVAAVGVATTAARADHVHAMPSAADVGAQPADATLSGLASLSSTLGLVEQTATDTFGVRALGTGASTSVLTRADGDGRYDAAGAASTVSSALTAHIDDTTAAHAASAIGYTPADAADWSPAPSAGGAALDQLADRVKTLETTPSGVASFNSRTGAVSPADGDYSQSLITGLKTTSSPSFVAITSTAPTGTAPLTVSSTTKVTNLNADAVDGYHAQTAAGSGVIPVSGVGNTLAAGFVATGTPTTGNVPTVQPDGTRVWQTPSGGGGGAVVGNIASGPNTVASGETRYLTIGSTTNPSVWGYLLEQVAGAVGATQTWTLTSSTESSFTQESSSGTEFTGSLERLQQTNDGYCACLLHFNNEQGTTTFVDATGKTVTRVGNPVLGTSPAGYRGNACGAFDGTGDRLTWASHADFALGTGDWTFEIRMYASVDANQRDTIFRIGTDSDAEMQVTLGAATASDFSSSGSKIGVHINYNGSSWGLQFAGTTSVCDSAWHHVAVVRQGDSVKLYIDGVLDGSGTYAFTYLQAEAAIGGSTADRYIQAYLDCACLSKGIARYTAAFTPPSSQLDYISYPSGTGYYTYPTSGLPAQVVDSITSIVVTSAEPTATAIRWLYSLDGGTVWKHTDGTTVALADIDSYGSTTAEVTSTFSSWSMPGGSTSFQLAWSLKADNGTLTPTVTSIVITYAGPASWKPVSDGSDWQVRVFPGSTGLVSYKRLAGTSAVVWICADNGN